MRISGVLEQTDGHFYAIEGARHDPASVGSSLASRVDSANVALAIIAPGNPNGRGASRLDACQNRFILQKERLGSVLKSGKASLSEEAI
jgi:hypothetical protein